MKALPFVISKKAVSDLEKIWLYAVEKTNKPPGFSTRLYEINRTVLKPRRFYSAVEQIGQPAQAGRPVCIRLHNHVRMALLGDALIKRMAITH